MWCEINDGQLSANRTSSKNEMGFLRAMWLGRQMGVGLLLSSKSLCWCVKDMGLSGMRGGGGSVVKENTEAEFSEMAERWGNDSRHV